MVPIAVYDSLEEAERAGALLLDNDIAADVRDTMLYVDEENVERATQLLDLPTEPVPQRREPFHPCPSCSTADPLWYGKRKAILIAGALGFLLYLGMTKSPAFWPTALIAVVVVAIAIRRVPEFECRHCHRRYS